MRRNLPQPTTGRVTQRCASCNNSAGVANPPHPQTIPQDMGKKRHTKEALTRAIRGHESRRNQAEICRQLNITAPTFDRWKKKLGMMTNSDAQRLQVLGLHRNTARYRAKSRQMMPDVKAALLEAFRRQPRQGHRKVKILVNRLLSGPARLSDELY